MACLKSVVSGARFHFVARRSNITKYAMSGFVVCSGFSFGLLLHFLNVELPK